MPEISRFFGIIIAMYYNDHDPPHFHARYGSRKAVIRIDPPAVMAGDLPPRALAMVIEWAMLHREALSENFAAARLGQPMQKIEPLQ